MGEEPRPEPSGSKIVHGSVVNGEEDAAEEVNSYDETSGISYEVQPRGLEGILGLADEPDEEPAGEKPEAKGPAKEAPADGEPETLVQEAVEEDAPEEKPPPPLDTGPRPHWNQSLLSDSKLTHGKRDGNEGPFGRLLGRRKDEPAPGRDGEPPLTRFRDLPLDQKMHYWRLRALIVIIVGVVFAIIAGWAVGITLAILAGIIDTIYRSRTVESHAYTPEGTVDRATLRAQKQTQKQLSSMERAGYISLHKRPIPNSVEVIDHLVIGPTGVYAIDSEKWQKDMPIRQSNGKKMWLGPESKTERLDHAKWEAAQASERLSAKLGMEVNVQPALAIYGPKISWVVLPVRGVDVFSGDHLKSYLRGRARRREVTPLTRDQIQQIYEAASDVLPTEWKGEVTPVG